MKKPFNTIYICLFLIFSWATSLFAGIDPVTIDSKVGSDFTLNNTWTVEEIRWQDMQGGQGTWGFKNGKCSNRMIFFTDLNTYQPNSFTAKLKLEVLAYGTDPVTGLPSSQYEVTHTPIFIIDYNPADHANNPNGFAGRSVFNFEQGYKLDIKVLEVEITENGVTSNTLPNYIKLESYIEVDRYHDFDRRKIPYISNYVEQNVGANNGKVGIHWAWPPLANGDPDECPGAVEYDFEWTWVDNYLSYNDVTNTVEYQTNKNLVEYDFGRNANRVTVTGTSYKIDKVFDHGYVVFRVRGVGRDILDPDQRQEGAWSAPQRATIQELATLTTNANHPPASVLVNPGFMHEPSLNWQYQIVFAEEGKSKQSITYADGSLRGRQSLSLISSKENRVIAQETIFDAFGRPAISLMPAPLRTTDDELKYYPNLNSNIANNPYSWRDFDKYECEDVVTPPMLTNSGTNQYYSTSNQDKDYEQAYVPDAQGFAFSQVEYTPDNTGRIKSQGGVGKVFQINKESTNATHESRATRFYYGDVKPIELDRLFGTDAGEAIRYKKNAVLDGNGQVSVSYLLGDRVVATALAGKVPDNLEALDNFQSPVSETYDFIAEGDNNKIDTDGRQGFVVDYKQLVTTAGQYEFNYSFKAQDFDGFCASANLCIDCVYELTISVLNDCGEEMLPGGAISQTIGPFDDINEACDALNFNPTNNPNENPFLRTAWLGIGNYTISKKLLLHKPSQNRYRELIMDPAINSCIPSLDPILDSLIAEADFSECEISSCRLIALQELPEDEWVASTEYPTYDDEIDDMEADCQNEAKSYCESLKKIMLLDVSPGGQYATYIEDNNGTYSSSDPYSLFNLSNSLLDYDGNPPSTPSTYQDIIGSFPATSAVPTPASASLKELIDNWDDSWSEVLIELHPEFCKYTWCTDNESSLDFDAQLAGITTVVQAQEAGFIPTPPNPPFPVNIAGLDPFFNGGAGVLSEINDALGVGFVTYEDNNGNSHTYSAWEAAVILSSCDFHPDDSDQVRAQKWIACDLQSPPDRTCNLDSEWLLYRSFYLSEKSKLVESSKTAPGYPCYDYSFPGSIPRVPDLGELLPGITLDGNNDLILDEIDPIATAGIAAQCASTCEGYRPYWEEQFETCTELTSITITDAQIQQVLDEFEKICKDGCDDTHPMGSSSRGNPMPPLSVYMSFAEAMEAILNPNQDPGISFIDPTVDPTVTDFFPSCNVFLISTPNPYTGQTLSGAAAGTFPSLDGCACDAVLSIEEEFNNPPPEGNPEGVNSPTDLFAYKYGNSASYEDLHCKCEDIWMQNYPNSLPYASGSDWSLASADLAAESDVLIPANMACETCITCNQISPHFENPDLITAFEGHPEGFDAFANYLNSLFNFNLSYSEYEIFYEDCTEANTTSACDETTQLSELIPFLNDLINQGELTDQEVDLSSYTSFTGSSLYESDPTSCLPISDARVLFSRTINAEIFTIIPTSTHGQLFVGKTPAGKLFIALQKSDDTYAWADQLALDETGISIDFENIMAVETQDNGFLLAVIYEDGQNNRDLNLIKVDEFGALDWEKRYAHQGLNKDLLGMFEQGNGNIVLGISQSPQTGGYHNSTLLLSVDNNGDQSAGTFNHEYADLGDVLFYPSRFENLKQLTQAEGDDFYLVAMNEGLDALNLIRFNSDGTLGWKNQYSEFSAYCHQIERSIGITSTHDDGVAVLVYEYGDNIPTRNRIFKVTKLGAQDQSFSSQLDEQPEYMAPGKIQFEPHDFRGTKDNGLLIGASNNFNAGRGLLLKLGPVGNFQWGKIRADLNQQHIRALEKEPGHYLLLQNRNKLENFIDIAGTVRNQCKGGLVAFTPQSFDNQEQSISLNLAQTPNLNLSSSNLLSSTFTLSETPSCGETLFLSLTDNCGLDCQLEMSLENGGVFRELTSFDSPVFTNPGFTVNANNASGPLTSVSTGTYSCLGVCGNGAGALALCNRSIFLEITVEDPCRELLEREAENQAFTILNRRLNKYMANFDAQYEASCLDIVNLEESFSFTYPNSEYHFTLYYYDQAGNLVQTVPPEGVKDLSNPTHTEHEFRTQYAYNSLNQAIWQHTPDGGEATSYYDDLGRLILSQNAKQKEHLRLSYVKYDGQGRLIESGELEYLPNTALPNHTNGFIAYEDYETWLVGKMILDHRITTYDNDDNFDPIVLALFENGEPEQLRSRVASSQYIDGTDASRDQQYFFSYDVHGNVKEIVIDNPALATLDEQYKKIKYDYDLFSGNVKQVSYQPGADDQFMHRYTYDADQRITAVETSHDGHNWENDANYHYYDHGPMARMELGEHQVAGMDYVYTLQGWISGVNSTLLDEGADPGKDGNSGPLPYTPLHASFARDAFAYSLGYYENDYQPITGPIAGFRADPSGLYGSAGAQSLYNGNIAWMSTSLVDDGVVSPLAAVFKYDQLQRLMEQKVYTDPGLVGPNSTNVWNPSPSNGDYQVNLSYDANGNILTLDRNGLASHSGGQAMDRLQYEYYRRPNPSGSGPDVRSNRLAYVKDNPALENAYDMDLDDQSSTYALNPLEGAGNGNYEYDKIGNLILDKQEKIANIEWTVSGKIRRITREANSGKPNLEFAYDVNDNRISKTVMDNPTEESTWKTTFYVRDLDGNPMSIYKKKYMTGPDFTAGHPEYSSFPTGTQYWAELWYQEEVPLYGSNRLGMKIAHKLFKVLAFTSASYDSEGRFDKDNVQFISPTPPANPVFTSAWPIGKKRYSLSEHRGNESVVITDHKLQIGTSSLEYFVSDVVSSKDYYPFGMEMPERGDPGSNNEDYRFGFQGQETDRELFGGAISYKYRVHDPRIGKFLSMDPLASDYPHNSPYAFSENRVIDGVELEGLEWISAENLWLHQANGDCKLETVNFNQLKSVVYRNSTYYWLGYDLKDFEGNLTTTWINESLSTDEQNSLRTFYNDYDEDERDRLGECHRAGCCIDCFNGAINELHGIGEDELDDSGVPGHDQTINHTLKILSRRGLAESIGSFSPVKNANGRATGFNNLENEILDSFDDIEGVYFLGVSLGNGYHSTALGVDYTDTSNPVYYFLDNHGIVKYTNFDDLVTQKYVHYTNMAIRGYGEGNYDVNLIVKKIDSAESK